MQRQFYSRQRTEQFDMLRTEQHTKIVF